MNEEIVKSTQNARLHNPRKHAAVRIDEYVFSQLIPYIGNKRKLLHLIEEAINFTGHASGTFVDLFAGSTVVSRWAKKKGYRIVSNDWEPYSQQIALGTVVPNNIPSFDSFGGSSRVFEILNNLSPVYGYVAKHLCPFDDEKPDILKERMFFTRQNGEKIDAIGEQIHSWYQNGLLTEEEKAYINAAFLYSVSYASNTSGVFKGFHNGWGGKTGTALYRIRGKLSLQQPILHDNGLKNLALKEDAQVVASNLDSICGNRPEIVYIDPPYNQHPYGSNYHILNTIALWDKPDVHPSILVDGKKHDKSAIRKDWRTERRSPYNSSKEALTAFQSLITNVQSKWILVSYSTDGNIPLHGLIGTMADMGQVNVFTQKYKRYRVGNTRYSEKSHNIEFVAVLKKDSSPSIGVVDKIVDSILKEEKEALG